MGGGGSLYNSRQDGRYQHGVCACLPMSVEVQRIRGGGREDSKETVLIGTEN